MNRCMMRPSRRRFTPPQDDLMFMIELRKILILTNPRSGRLEGRTAVIRLAR
jgi:hypothetical protein